MFGIIGGLASTVTQFLIKFMSWGVRFLYVGFIVVAFIMIFNLFQSGISIAYNTSVLSDILAIVQIWLPFNLGGMINWLMGAASLLLLYYMYAWGMTLINNLTRD